MLTPGFVRCLLSALQYSRRDFSSFAERTRRNGRVAVVSAKKSSLSVMKDEA